MAEPSKSPVPHLTDEEIIARRRKRSIALGLVLGALVLIFYALTIVRMGGNVFQRPL